MHRMWALGLLAACTGAAEKDPEGPEPQEPEEVVDEDQDGFDSTEDCDDSDPDVHPDRNERCNGVDDDCDGEIDADATNADPWYADADGDGYGDAGSEVLACEAPSDHVTDASDCDDTDPDVHPSADELCDGLDNDCDETVDTDATDRLSFHPDTDGDGYGDEAASVLACEAPADHVADGTDCDDSDETVNPGTLWYADNDWDSYGNPDDTTASCLQPWGYVSTATDCDDTSGAVAPGASEVCDGLDNDCDTDIDGPEGACEALQGTYTGTYALLTEEKLGSIVINSMSCDEPSTMELIVDLSASPAVSGTASCSYGGSLGGFDDDQDATFELSLTPEGLLSGYVYHDFDSWGTEWFEVEGTISGGEVLLVGEGLYWPSIYSAVGWETVITVEGSL